MEAFVHTVADSLNLSAIAYCKKFNGRNNYLVIGNGSTLNFYQFSQDIPIFEFNYHLFGDISLLIPYISEDITILIVVLSSTKFCVLHYDNGQIICDQNGELTASVGTDIRQKYSYSIYKSLLLIQIWQEGLQLYQIKKKKLIFIQDFSFFTSVIYRFQLISSNQFVVLQSKFESSNAYEIYNFDIISQELSEQFVLSKEVNNFLRTKKNCFLISKEKFFEIKEKELQTIMEINLADDIFDAAQLNDNLFFVVTFSGEILLIEKQDDQKSKIVKIGDVCKPLKIIIIGKNQIIIPSRYGATKYFCLNGHQFVLKDLFDFPGKVMKFVKLSKRSFLGLTQTNCVHLVEKTLSLNDVCDYQFESKSRCWFIDEEKILFSTEKFSKVLNFHDQSENTEFCIQNNIETIGFQMMLDDKYIQITKTDIFINNERLSISFLNISLVKFSDCSFCFVDNLSHVFVFSFDGEIILHHEFPFQINSIALFKDDVLAVSSWEESTILVIGIKSSNEEFIEVIHEFKKMTAIDLLFTGDGDKICALPSKNEVYFLNSSDHSVEKIQCEGNFFKLFPISETEILISGEKSYLIEEQIITELLDVEPFHFADSLDDLLLFCNVNNSLSIKKRRIKSYQFRSKTLKMTFKLIDVVEYDQDLNAVVLKGDANKINIALAKNILDFKNYKIFPQNFFQNQKSSIRLITVKDFISNKPFIVVLSGNEIFSLSYGNDDLFSQKSSFKFDTKPVGLTNIENNIFCLILVDKIFVFSLEEGIIIKLSSFSTLGATSCFYYMNKKLLIGDMIESLIIYEYQENKSFNEVYRESHEISCSSCVFINDELIFCADQNSYVYQLKLSQIKNYASNELIIERVCSIGSSAKAMILCDEENSILIGSSNGEIIECKEVECPEIFQNFYGLIENSLVSLGGFESAPYRRCICMGYFLGIPRIYDADLLKTFIDLNEEQKTRIIQKNDFDLKHEDAEIICNQILDSI